MTPTIIFYILLSILSLLIGSLLNVIVHRLPLMLETEWKAQCRNLLQLKTSDVAHEKINLFFPRSFCPACKHKIPFWHNIPLISYCILLGRCHACDERISFRYPLIELLTLTFSLLAAWHWGFNITLVFVLLYLWILIVIFFIDLQHQIIPDVLSLSLLWIGLIANTNELFTPLSIAVLSAAIAYLSLWLFMKLFYLVTGKIGMGHGDFKLFAAFGAWFGWLLLPFILLISSIIGAIIGLLYLKATTQHRDTPIPFGPFLCFAGFFSIFYGNQLVQWYISLYL